MKKKRIKPYILDGAMGTELIRRSVNLPLPLWSGDANLTHPETVIQIHQDYVNAGADILTTNTFRTTPRTYLKSGFKIEGYFQEHKYKNGKLNDLVIVAIFPLLV